MGRWAQAARRGSPAAPWDQVVLSSIVLASMPNLQLQYVASKTPDSWDALLQDYLGDWNDLETLNLQPGSWRSIDFETEPTGGVAYRAKLRPVFDGRPGPWSDWVTYGP